MCFNYGIYPRRVSVRILFYRVIIFGFFLGVFSLFLNYYVVQKSKSFISTDAKELARSYTVIVLGAKVYDNGNLSSYLKDRVDGALLLYKEGKVKRFLLSGDHGTKQYDEVNTMKEYLMEEGVPSADIFLDHAGFNTYNSMLRAKKVFEVKDCIVVSQDYHLPRAVYIARSIGMNAYGFAQDSNHLSSIKFNKKREILARVKSFGEVLFSISPTYLGEKIPITGDSSLSYD